MLEFFFLNSHFFIPVVGDKLINQKFRWVFFYITLPETNSKTGAGGLGNDPILANIFQRGRSINHQLEKHLQMDSFEDEKVSLGWLNLAGAFAVIFRKCNP